MTNPFAAVTPRTASRVKALRVVLLISEDDVASIPEEKAEDGTVIREAVEARIRESENNTFTFEILDENGEVMDRRMDELEGNLPPGLKGKASAILAHLFKAAKAGIAA